MDMDVASKLKEAGIVLRMAAPLASIQVKRDGPVEVFPVGPDVVIVQGERCQTVVLRPLRELFRGSRVPPSFQKGPTSEYDLFFITVERAAVDYCKAAGRAEVDVEFERVYNQLRRRPDGKDSNLVFGYLRAAFQLYMSVFETSQAEFEAVASRLCRSARTFSMGPSTRNYIETIRDHIKG